MWIACRLGFHLLGYTLARRTIDAIANGVAFPGEVLSDAVRTWHPDDYVHSNWKRCCKATGVA